MLHKCFEKKKVLNILLRKQIGKNTQFPHSRTVGEMEGFPSQEIAAVCFSGSTCQESEQVGPGTVDSWVSGLASRRLSCLLWRKMNEE